MSRSDAKARSQAMSAYMKSRPNEFPDSISGGGWGGMGRRLSHIPRGPMPMSQFERGMLGGILAHKIGYECPITTEFLKK